MKKSLWMVVLGAVVIGLTVGACSSLCRIPVSVSLPAGSGHILLDPGHGGEDGGAAATDGTLEKDINLDIGLDLYTLLRLWGYSVKMTRQTDVSIHTKGQEAIRNKKVSDMHNRLAMYEQADLVISIHQNHFSIPKYNGAQVFYSGNSEKSRLLASAVRQELITRLQPENNRELKQATDGIYLLYHTTRPAILVECGFLSNREECEKLKQPLYRQQIAFSIFCGYWQYQMAE